MDTRTAKIDVGAKIEEIKRFMPETYKSIQAKSKEIGNEAFVSKAPPAVLDETKKRVADFGATLDKIRQQLQRMG